MSYYSWRLMNYTEKIALLSVVGALMFAPAVMLQKREPSRVSKLGEGKVAVNELIAHLASYGGIVAAFVYGSLGRRINGTENGLWSPGSDIDVTTLLQMPVAEDFCSYLDALQSIHGHVLHYVHYYGDTPRFMSAMEDAKLSGELVVVKGDLQIIAKTLEPSLDRTVQILTRKGWRAERIDDLVSKHRKEANETLLRLRKDLK